MSDTILYMVRTLTKEDLEKVIDKFDLKSLTSDQIYAQFAKDLDLTKEELEGVIFATLFAYKTERLLTDTLHNVYDNLVHPEQTDRENVISHMKSLVDELHFLGKIKVTKKFTRKAFANAVSGMLDKVNTLRNDLAHIRLKELTYGNVPLKDLTGRQKMLDEYREAVINSLIGARASEQTEKILKSFGL